MSVWLLGNEPLFFLSFFLSCAFPFFDDDHHRGGISGALAAWRWEGMHAIYLPPGWLGGWGGAKHLEALCIFFFLVDIA